MKEWLVMAQKLNLINIDSSQRINDKWYLHDINLQKIVSNFPAESTFKNFIDTYTTIGYDHQLYQQSFLQVVTETVYNYPVCYISEKTIKPIVNKRPFVILGPVHSLKCLQSLGFRTFDNFWDESYDDIASPENRLIAVFDIINDICQKSLSDLQSLCKDMENTLNYNFEFYKNSFMCNELATFKTACQNNLGIR